LGVLLNLTKLAKKVSLSGDIVTIRGPVTWHEIKNYLVSHDLEMPCAPTETSACVLAGLATSATGERSFGYGALKHWVKEITYMNHLGEIKTLGMNSNREISSAYKESYKKYSFFKNAPFPKLETELDLMIGTEGQLGIIIEAKFKTIKRSNTQCLLMKLPSWIEDYSEHLKIFTFLQDKRGKILSAEFFDRACLSYLPLDEKIDREHDYLALEIKSEDMTEIVDKLILNFSAESFISIEVSECQRLRLAIPRYVNEHNSRNKLRKLGTDIQVSPAQLEKLLQVFGQLTKENLPFCLFGHFGDAHLHFNFLTNQSDYPRATSIMNKVYKDLVLWKFPLSPFAEHGIGLIKQPYIKEYWSDVHFSEFKKLKNKYDPDRLFFPKGFMNL
jgi:glycolate oxidase